MVITTKKGAKITITHNKRGFEVTIPKMGVKKTVNKITLGGNLLIIDELKVKAKLDDSEAKSIQYLLDSVKDESDEVYERLEEKFGRVRGNLNPDDQKAQKLIDEAKSIQFFADEDLNEGPKLRRLELLDKAQTLCDHDFKIDYRRGTTEGYRKKVTRLIICEKCKLVNTEVVTE